MVRYAARRGKPVIAIPAIKSCQESFVLSQSFDTLFWYTTTGAKISRLARMTFLPEKRKNTITLIYCPIWDDNGTSERVNLLRPHVI
jgi:hypothetical protein